MAELKACTFFFVMNLIILVSTITAKPTNTTRSDQLKFYDDAIKLDDVRKNKTITTTPTTRLVTYPKRLSKFAMTRKKTVDKLHELKNRITIKPTQESMMHKQTVNLPNTTAIDIESWEVPANTSSEYDEAFVDKLIKKYKMLSDLEKLYELTTIKSHYK